MANQSMFDYTQDASAPLLSQAEIEMLLNPELIERRRHLRRIPCPEAIELDDEASWSTWNELAAQ
ncbi:hypothetical protein [Rhodoferax sp. GW822-FHT02A01]|uniref:hypothetical protein n=1 Tax=Rhodoferax sp. GW822-FHT02A01 TaxID=3141537 RepID=UPI00315CFB57